MIFSVLEKLEQGARTLDERELALMRPYWGTPALRPVQTLQNLLRLHMVSKNDQEWAAEADAQLVYEMMFRDGGSPLGGAVYDIVGDNKPYMHLTQHWALRRSLVEGDMKGFSAAFDMILACPDDGGVAGLVAALTYNNDEGFLTAARCGRHDALQIIFSAIDEAAGGQNLVNLDDRDRLTNMTATAARADEGAEETVDFLLNRARAAGNEKDVLRITLPLALAMAGLAENLAWQERLWQRGLDVLGRAGMTNALKRERGGVFSALGRDMKARGLDSLLRLSLRDLGSGEALNFMVMALFKETPSKDAVTTVMALAHEMGGIALTDHIVRADRGSLMYRAAMYPNTEMLEFLEKHTDPAQGMPLDFMETGTFKKILMLASPAAIEFLGRKAHALHGMEALKPLCMDLGDAYVSSRADYMDVINIVVRLRMDCAHSSNMNEADKVDIALPSEAVDLLRMSAQKRIAPHEFWQLMGGGNSRWQAVARCNAPEGVEPTDSPWRFRPALYEQLLPHMRRLIALEEIKSVKPEALAYRFAVMFTNLEEVERYIDRTISRARPQQRISPFREAAHFNIPQRGMWDVAHWRGLLMKHGYSVGKYIHAASEIEADCSLNDKPLPRNADELIDAARFVLIRDAEENPAFARLVLEHDLGQDLFDKGLKILRETAKKDDVLPVVTIDGTAIGKPNYYMQKLPANDPQGFVLGHLTNSCQSLGGNGEYAVIDGMTSRTSGFYVWKQKTKGRMTDRDRIVAQCWAWAATDPQDIVFDSFERLSPDYNHLVRPFLEQYTYDLKKAGTLSRVFLGAGGSTPPDAGFEKTAQPVQRTPRIAAYPDSREQYTVRPVNHRAPS